MKIIKERFSTKKLPHGDHVDWLNEQSYKANEAVDKILNRMLKALARFMREEKLAKSEGDEPGEFDFFPRRYTGMVPRIEIDMGILTPIIDQYLQPIKWIMLGKAAGKDVQKIVEDLGLMNVIPNGLVYGSFLHSLDTQRAYYEFLTNKDAPDIDNKFLKYALDMAQKKTTRYIDDTLSQYKSKIINTLENEVIQENKNNVSAVHEAMHDQLKTLKEKLSGQKEKTKAMNDIIDDVASNKISMFSAKKALRDVFDDISDKMDTAITNEMAVASSAGTQVAIQELFGPGNDVLRVAIVNVRDPRCCNHCEETSRNDDGTIRLYHMSDLAAAGSNMGKKKISWTATLPPQHPRCYSSDTEVLTQRGWVKWPEATVDDIYMSINPDNWDDEWVSAKTLVKYWLDGQMEHRHSDDFNLMTTPNHTHVMFDGQGLCLVNLDETEQSDRPFVGITSNLGLILPVFAPTLSLVEYKDFVYDVELEKNHTLVVRREGKIALSGNCRCHTVFVPKGFNIDKDGIIYREEKAPS